MRKSRLVLAVALIATALLAVILGSPIPVRGPARPVSTEFVEREVPPTPPPVEETAPETIPAGWRMVEGIVLDARTLLPVESARVVFGESDEAVETKTDENGRWRHPLPRHTDSYLWSRVTAKGYLPRRLDLYPDFGGFRVSPAPPPVYLRRATVQIFGLVLGPDGQPVQDADVVGDGAAPTELRTDRAGRFGPIPASHGEFAFEVFAAGGLGWWHVIYIPFEASGRFDVTMRIPAPRYVTGITVDDRGRPIPGVLLADGWGAPGARVSSDEEGRFRWPLTGPSTDLTAVKDGYICTSDNMVYPESHVEVVLERAASIEGRIVRADGSPPPPGLCVRFGRTMSAVADVADDGAFRIGRILASRSELAIGHAGTVRVANRWLTTLDPKLEPGEQRTGFVIRLPRLKEVRGRVIDAETRLPIGGASVNSSPTGRDGSYALPVSADNREMGGIHLDVFATGYLPLRTRHSETQPVALRPARVVSVVVVDEAGRPLPGTLVRVLGAEPYGNRISGVADGVGRCRVRTPAGEASVVRCTALRHDPVEVSCEVGQTELRVVVGPPEARFIIVATDETGNPLEGAYLEDEVGRTWADAAGRIPIARPEGDAFLSAPGRERIPFEADESEGLIEFRLREAAPILLRIVYADGTPVPQAYVRSPRDSYWADADGRISIDGYARGETVRVEYDVEGWQQTAIEVTAGEPLRTIRLPGRGEIVVRFAPAESNGEPPVARLYGPGLWKDELEFPFYERASPGEVRFSVQDAVACLFFRAPPGAFRFYPDLRVRAGEMIELNYDFPQPGRICGLVLGPNGDPLDDADVTLFEFGEERGYTWTKGSFDLDLSSYSEDSAIGMIRLLVTHYDCAPFLTEPIDLGKDRDLTIRLSMGGTLGGRVLGIEGEVAVTILTPGAAADPVVKSGEDGRFSFQGRVRAGRHPIEIRTRSGETYLREVEVENGVDTKVTFRLP